jgi:hypothetical protein
VGELGDLIAHEKALRGLLADVKDGSQDKGERYFSLAETCEGGNESCRLVYFPGPSIR